MANAVNTAVALLTDEYHIISTMDILMIHALKEVSNSEEGCASGIQYSIAAIGLSCKKNMYTATCISASSRFLMETIIINTWVLRVKLSVISFCRPVLTAELHVSQPF